MDQIIKENTPPQTNKNQNNESVEEQVLLSFESWWLYFPL